METIFERVGALDVHKAQVTACVRVPGPDGRREPDVVQFATTVQGLMAMLQRLAQRGDHYRHRGPIRTGRRPTGLELDDVVEFDLQFLAG